MYCAPRQASAQCRLKGISGGGDMPKKISRDIARPAYRRLEAVRPDDGLFVAVLAVFLAWFVTMW